jgi:hypothetical protein
MSTKSLQSALEAATRENAELRRELAGLRAENEHLRGIRDTAGSRPQSARADRMARVRVMLKDQHSCNP